MIRKYISMKSSYKDPFLKEAYAFADNEQVRQAIDDQDIKTFQFLMDKEDNTLSKENPYETLFRTYVHKSFYKGALFCLKCGILSKKGFNKNYRYFEEHQTTPLMLAIKAKLFTLADALIVLGADIHLTDNQGNSALSLAISAQSFTLVHRLLNEGVQFDQQKYFSLKNLPAPLSFLLSSLYQPYRAPSGLLMRRNALNKYSETPWISAKNYTVEELEYALAHQKIASLRPIGLDPSLRAKYLLITPEEYSPAQLRQAVFRGDLALLRKTREEHLLLYRDKEDNTLFHTAVSACQPEILQWFAKMFSSLPTNKKGKTPLHTAAEENYKEGLWILISYFPAQAFALDNDGNNILHYAGYQGSNILINFLKNSSFKALLKHGDIPNQERYGPLDVALNNHCVYLAAYFRELGFQLNQKMLFAKESKFILAHCAIIQESPSSFKFHFSDSMLKDQNAQGETLLHIALQHYTSCRNPNYVSSIIEHLILSGADINQPNKQGRTANDLLNELHIPKLISTLISPDFFFDAVTRGLTEVVSTLLKIEKSLLPSENFVISLLHPKSPILPYSKDIKGMTGLAHATKQGHLNLITLLLQHGSKLTKDIEASAPTPEIKKLFEEFHHGKLLEDLASSTTPRRAQNRPRATSL